MVREMVPAEAMASIEARATMYFMMKVVLCFERLENERCIEALKCGMNGLKTDFLQETEVALYFVPASP